MGKPDKEPEDADDGNYSSGVWSKEENIKFVEGAKLYGPRNFQKISEFMVTRSFKQGIGAAS